MKKVTHITCLKAEDRFYAASDTKKTVWQFKYHTTLIVRGFRKRFSWCKNDAGEWKRFDANRVIVLLRMDAEKVQASTSLKLFAT